MNENVVARTVVLDAMRNAQNGSARDLMWLVSPDAELYLQVSHIDRSELLRWTAQLLTVGVPKITFVSSSVQQYSPSTKLNQKTAFIERNEHRKDWLKKFQWKEHYGKREKTE